MLNLLKILQRMLMCPFSSFLTIRSINFLLSVTDIDGRAFFDRENLNILYYETGETNDVISLNTDQNIIEDTCSLV